MSQSWNRIAVCVASLAVSFACNGRGDTEANRRAEPGAEGTTGTSVETTLTGCLERNVDTGQFVLVVQGDAGPNTGMQPASERIVLTKATDDIEFNQDVGKQVTVQGTIGKIDAIADAGTEAPVAGRGADPAQTNEAHIRGMRVSRVQSGGDTCALSER
jgi:hypothetical protein